MLTGASDASIQAKTNKLNRSSKKAREPISSLPAAITRIMRELTPCLSLRPGHLHEGPQWIGNKYRPDFAPAGGEIHTAVLDLYQEFGPQYW